jgi:hypothetical protein
MRYLLDRTGLVAGCFGGLVISALFGYGAVARPEIHRVFTVAPAIAFAGVGILAGYRALSPDAWFAARDRRVQEWCARHPVLGMLCALLSLICFVSEVVRMLFRLGLL